MTSHQSSGEPPSPPEGVELLENIMCDAPSRALPVETELELRAEVERLKGERDQYDADLKLMAEHANALSDLRRAAEATLSEVVGVLEPFARMGDLIERYGDFRKAPVKTEWGQNFRAAAALLTLLREGGVEGVVQTNVAPQCGVGPSDLTDQGGEPCHRCGTPLETGPWGFTDCPACNPNPARA